MSFLHEYIYELRSVPHVEILCFSRSCHTGGSVDASRGKLIHIFLGQQRQLLTSASLNLYQEVKAEIQGPNEVSLQPCVSLCTRLLHASEVTGAGGNKQQLLAIFHLLLHNFPDFNISL